MIGIKNIKIKTFTIGLFSDDDIDDTVNEFLKEHDGTIIDIQFLKNESVMVVYADKESET